MRQNRLYIGRHNWKHLGRNQDTDRDKSTNDGVVYQGPNQTNQDSIEAWLKHEEPNSTRQQQEDINQTPSPSEYSLQQDKESG